MAARVVAASRLVGSSLAEKRKCPCRRTFSVMSRSGLCTGRTERGTRCRRRVGPDAGQCHLHRSHQRRTTDTTATEVTKIVEAFRPSGFETLLAGQIRTAGFQNAVAKAARTVGTTRAAAGAWPALDQ